MAQVLDHLCGKCENLGSISSARKKRTPKYSKSVLFSDDLIHGMVLVCIFTYIFSFIFCYFHHMLKINVQSSYAMHGLSFQFLHVLEFFSSNVLLYLTCLTNCHSSFKIASKSHFSKKFH
jgi:hypothetical protein